MDLSTWPLCGAVHLVHFGLQACLFSRTGTSLMILQYRHIFRLGLGDQYLRASLLLHRVDHFDPSDHTHHSQHRQARTLPSSYESISEGLDIYVHHGTHYYGDVSHWT